MIPKTRDWCRYRVGWSKAGEHGACVVRGIRLSPLFAASREYPSALDGHMKVYTIPFSELYTMTCLANGRRVPYHGNLLECRGIAVALEQILAFGDNGELTTESLDSAKRYGQEQGWW